MKMQYMKPACTVNEIETQNSLLISSPQVDHTPENDLVGDLNFETFTDIWGNDL